MDDREQFDHDLDKLLSTMPAADRQPFDEMRRLEMSTHMGLIQIMRVRRALGWLLVANAALAIVNAATIWWRFHG